MEPILPDNKLSQLIREVYEELRRIARSYRRNQREDPISLNTTALVHEAVLKIANTLSRADSQSYLTEASHARAIACRAMRQILFNYHREKNAEKRNYGEKPIPLHDVFNSSILLHSSPTEYSSDSYIDLYNAIDDLERLDSRSATVVDMIYFGGFNHDEVAHTLGLSVSTISRDWANACLHLRKYLDSQTKENGGDPPTD